MYPSSPRFPRDNTNGSLLSDGSYKRIGNYFMLGTRAFSMFQRPYSQLVLELGFDWHSSQLLTVVLFGLYLFSREFEPRRRIG
jgi:hypothetical protein